MHGSYKARVASQCVIFGTFNHKQLSYRCFDTMADLANQVEIIGAVVHECEHQGLCGYIRQID